MISYFGEKILTASSLLTNQAYSTSWYMASDRFRKNLLILMLQLNRESKISAGKIFPINLALFTAVIILNMQGDEFRVNIDFRITFR